MFVTEIVVFWLGFFTIKCENRFSLLEMKFALRLNSAYTGLSLIILKFIFC